MAERFFPSLREKSRIAADVAVVVAPVVRVAFDHAQYRLNASLAMQALTHRFRIVNAVLTMDLGRTINLAASCIVMHGKLSMGVFPAHVNKCRGIRWTDDTGAVRQIGRCTNCSFETGKVVTTGAINFQSALVGAMLFVARLSRDLKYDLDIRSFAVQNIVGAVYLGYNLNLKMFMNDRAHLNDCKWHMSLFPGLKYSTAQRDIRLIMFESGEVIATGPKQVHRMLVAEQLLRDLHLERYRVGSEYRTPTEFEQPTPPRDPNEKKKAKVAKFKVISHTRKRAWFKQEMMTMEMGGQSSSSSSSSTTKKKKTTKRKHASSSSTIATNDDDDDDTANVVCKRVPTPLSTTSLQYQRTL